MSLPPLTALSPLRDVAAQRGARAREGLAWADSAERARQQADWPRYARFADSVYSRIGNYPSVVWGQARAAARRGDTARLVDRLSTYAAMGFVRDLAADSAFAPYRGRPWFDRAADRIRRAGAEPRRSLTRTTLADSMFVPEGIAIDARDGSVLVSSIHRGQVARVAPGGDLRPVVRLADADLGAAYGIAIDQNRRLLYVGSQQIPQYEGFAAKDSGRTAVGVFELDTGKPVRRLDAPVDGKPHSFGDLAVAADGTLYVSDAEGGAIYTTGPGAGALTRLAVSQELFSPQGITFDENQRYLFVADYLLGIVRVERRTGRSAVVPHLDSVAVAGIDGLTRWHRSLVGVQNGFLPKRVVALDFDASGERIVASRVLEANREVIGGEATHVVALGDTLLFLANTGWDAFNVDGSRKPEVVLSRARIAQVHQRQSAIGDR